MGSWFSSELQAGLKITWEVPVRHPLQTPHHPAASASPPAASDLQTAVLQSFAEVRALAPEWDALLDRMPRPSPFLTWDWMETWWEEFGKASQPLVAVARNAGGELVGLAPLHVVRRRSWGLVETRTLEFIGYRGSSVCADHLDFLALPAIRTELVQALVAALCRLPGWDAWDLADLAEDSPLPAAWRQARESSTAALEPGEVCYFICLPGSADQYWSEMRQHHARTVANLGRDRRRLERRFQARFSVVRGPAAVAETMDALARLHTAAHARRGESGNFARPAYRRFHDRLAARCDRQGMLYLARLDLDQRPAAVLYGFFRGGVLSFYQSGFDPSLSSDGVGRLLLAWVLEDAITRLHAREFDFLRGAEAYKEIWAAAAHHTRHWRGWRGNAAGRLAQLEWRTRRQLRRLRSWLGARWRRPTVPA